MTATKHTWTTSEVHNILFPTDFSHHSEHAMTYALALAKDFDAVVHILHVIDTGYLWETQPFEREGERAPGTTIQDAVEAQVDELVKKAQDAGVKAEGHWRKGKVDQEILRLIDLLDIGLVLMATHARDKSTVTVQGSDYLKTIHDADLPVIGVKRSDREFVKGAGLEPSVRKILCPCDLTDFSHQPVPFAAELCRHYNADLVLAHVVHTYEEYISLEGLGGKPAAGADTYEALDHLVEAHNDVPSKITVVKGKPEPELAKICENENIDLVVIATHGRKPFVRSFLGSIAEHLIIDVPCPIMTIRPERIAERLAS